MGLFKSKNERLADDAIQQGRELGGTLVDAAGSAIDQGSHRLKRLIEDLESALKSTDLSASASAVRGKLGQVREVVADRRAALSDDFSDALGTADQFAHDKPWQVIGAVAGVALLIGFLAGRS